MPGEQGTDGKVVATNRKARHDYHILDTLEAGIVLTGNEVKSLRQGNVSLTDGYARIHRGELWLTGVHVSPYKQGSITNADPLRERKLLVHRRELLRLFSTLKDKGITLVPLRLYFKKNIAKVELGICRGKRAYDKRQAIARREAERDLQRDHRR